jgi:hypothetical protein
MRRIKVVTINKGEPGEINRPMSCMHCVDPSCVVGILFHFYMAHLSPEHFPMDCVIFNREMSIKEGDISRIREIKDEGVVV